jgi:putative membrane protein
VSATDPELPKPTWSRPARRMLLADPLISLLRAAPLLLGLVLVTGDTGHALAAGWLLSSLAYGMATVATTRYRITEHHLELRSGVLARRRRTIPRDRIRVVDRTARLRHRMVGVTRVRIGTGEPGLDEHLHLGVTHREAERLREVLLGRNASPNPADSGETVLMTVPSTWAWFAPFTLTGLVLAGTLALTVRGAAGDLGVDLLSLPLVTAVEQWAQLANPLVVATAAVLAVTLVTTLLSTIAYLTANWRFTLTRDADGALHLRRGLLTTRATSVQQHRIRGVERVVPLPLGLVRGAIARVMVSGEGRYSLSPVLVPAGPRRRVHQGIAAVFGSDPTAAHLQRHPRAALARRLTRAVLPTLGISVILWWLAEAMIVPAWTWPAALAVVPVAAGIGWHRYRNLGHALVGPYLVSRSGSLRQQTTAVLHSGITDLSLEQTLLQRRSGLITMDATIAAGRGSCILHDLAEADAVELARQVAPGLLDPFLVTGAAEIDGDTDVEGVTTLSATA